MAERVSRLEAYAALLAAVHYGIPLRTWQRWRRIVKRLLAKAGAGLPWQIGARDSKAQT